MGDLLMSSPAIKALKETFDARITVLTSGMAAGIAGFIPEIDDVIGFNLPWVKLDGTAQPQDFMEIVGTIKERNFDAAVIFSVYSQNSLPAAMLSYLSGIPRRLAYCRENPYNLLTNWIPDPEPYSVIKHQVRRDLDLVTEIGAFPVNENLSLAISNEAEIAVSNKLRAAGVDMSKPWIIAHAGVSEEKRRYPFNFWVEACNEIILGMDYQILFTGVASERSLTDTLQIATGANSFSFAGDFTLEEFIALIKMAPLLISVNTSSIHIAAAVSTPVIVLYAQTNPQHFPWQAEGKVFTYSVPTELQSKNEVIRYVNQKLFSQRIPPVPPKELATAAAEILYGEKTQIPELPEEWLVLFN